MAECSMVLALVGFCTEPAWLGCDCPDQTLAFAGLAILDSNWFCPG